MLQRSSSIDVTDEALVEQSRFMMSIAGEMSRVVVGQRAVVERMLVGLLCNGHLLVEGVPGLAKTLLVRTLGDALSLQFNRIQFTPDLLPSDVVGTQVLDARSGDFKVKRGPVFTNLLLADEINRAPAKVQSALLEAMQERQVTLGDHTHALPDPFLVLATQNPLEHEGTYPLPEAQLDRFMLKVLIDYPLRVEEREILKRMTGLVPPRAHVAGSGAQLADAKEMVAKVHVEGRIFDYVLDLVEATRKPEAHGLKEMQPLLDGGASPRAGIALVNAARAMAFLRGRPYVLPEDVKALAPDVLRHRIVLSYEAEADRVTPDALVTRLLEGVVVP
ncbi:MAG TPA: AAA family ATPase [Myxococcales bacterium]|nr:AAA family ATPase [Myxococcales bacterium]